jgi:hypothetical protein
MTFILIVIFTLKNNGNKNEEEDIIDTHVDNDGDKTPPKVLTYKPICALRLIYRNTNDVTPCLLHVVI